MMFAVGSAPVEVSSMSKQVHPARMGARTSSWWSDLTREHGYESLQIEGEIPDHLTGTLYKTGPALTQRFGRPYHHVFEGDGAICATRLHDGEVEGAHKLLRNDGFIAEERAGRPLFQSAVPHFVNVINMLRGRSKNTANTNVMLWHDTLFGLMENAQLVAFDKQLDTIGESSLGGVVKGSFSAHPHAVNARRAIYNFGMEYGRKTLLNLYELPFDGPARRIHQLPLAAPVMLHDFMATRDHLVLLVSPYQLVLWRAILGIGGFKKLFDWRPEVGTEVIVVPIDTPAKTRRFTVDAFFQIHFAGGFDEPDAVVVDASIYPDASALERNVSEVDRPPEAGVLTRIRIPHGADRIEKERIADQTIEFASIDSRFLGERYDQVFGITVDSTRFGLVRVDLEAGKEDCYWLPEGEFASEPTFVPKPGGDPGDGHVLVLTYDSSEHRSNLAVFDSRSLESGPVGRAHFDHHIPSGFHGIWVPE